MVFFRTSENYFRLRKLLYQERFKDKYMDFQVKIRPVLTSEVLREICLHKR